VAQRDEAQRQLDHTVVKAPFTGIVPRYTRSRAANISPASTTAFISSHRITSGSTRPERDELTYVRPGQPVTVPSTPIRAPNGKARREHRPGGGAGVRAIAAQNTSGNWVKVVQRIPMRVRVTLAKRAYPRCAPDERRDQCRHGACAWIAALPDALFGGRARGSRNGRRSQSDGVNRAAITVCVVLATLMQAP